MNKHQLKEVSKDTMIETFLDIIQSQGTDFIKEQGLSLISEIGFETALSFVPALGGAISTYRTHRAIRNLELQVQQLAEYQEAIQKNLNTMSVEVRRELDKVFLYMLEKTVNEKQEQKIQFLTNAFINITKHSEIDVDVSYIYFDTLEQLTFLDIKVLVEISKSYFYYYLHPDEQPDTTINDEQFSAIKSNLYRLGLAENKFEKDLAEDLGNTNTTLEELRKAIIELQEVHSKSRGKITAIKNKTKAKVSKVKARDKIVISDFGKEMIEFFKEQEATNETSI